MDIAKIASEVLNLEADELRRQAGLVGSEFQKAVNLIYSCKGKLIVTGVGKSGHIGAKIAATLASTGTPSFFIHPTEAMHGDLGMIGSDDAVLAISYSGESAELLAILPHIKRRDIKIIGISKSGSSLANLSDANLNIDIEREACPIGAAPTVSTTLTLALGDALAVCLMKLRDFKSEDFAAFHPGGSLGKRLYLKVKDTMRKSNLPIVKDDISLKSAITTMSEGRLGSVILVDNDGKLSGILSDGDLRRALEQDSFDINSKAIEFATKNPKTLDNPDMLAYDAFRLIEEYKIQILIIQKDQKPIGLLHIHDLTSLGL